LYKLFITLTFLAFFYAKSDIIHPSSPLRAYPAVVIQGGPGMSSSYLYNYFMPLSKVCRLFYTDKRVAKESVSISAITADVEQIRKKLKADKIILIAHSFGCIPALKYLLSNPKNVYKALFISSYARRHPNQYDKFYKALNYYRGTGDVNIFKTSLYFNKPEYKTKAFIKKFLASYSFNKRVFEIITQSQQFKSFDIRKNLKKINPPPSLIICGKHDLITPPFLSQELCDVLKGSKLVIFKKSGHYPFIEENLNFIARVKRFLLTP
jgi:proline iminopeptidase